MPVSVCPHNFLQVLNCLFCVFWVITWILIESTFTKQSSVMHCIATISVTDMACGPPPHLPIGGFTQVDGPLNRCKRATLTDIMPVLRQLH